MENLRNEVITALKKKLGDGYRIFPEDQRKNNELVLQGIRIQKEDNPVSPVVYVGEFAHPYAAGKLDAGKIADILLERCSQGEIPQNLAYDLKDFDRMKGMVRIRLVNYGANSKALANSPHRRFLDLAISYYLDIETGMAGRKGTGGITNALMEIWGVSEDELYRLGMDRLLTADGCYTIDLLRLLALENGLDENEAEELLKDQDRARMYVATNRKHQYGASCLLDRSLLKKMAEDVGCSLIIYPGSIHEIVILPQKDEGESYLDTGDVQAINYNCALQDEWLSNSIYYFDREKQEVSIYKEGMPLPCSAA
ncbi:MAG: DUF5688 family protein [Butyrivibrio sp.]|nr:DUF5688 family protein [Butyrivibrio sp.]